MSDDYLFVVYGAGSEIISPIFSAFPQSHFIGLVRNTVPQDQNVTCLSTAELGWEENLAASLKERSKERLIFVNAAALQFDALLISYSKDQIEKMIEANVRNPVIVSQIVVREMAARKFGRIINLSSFRAEIPAKGTSIYSGAKAFSNAFFKTLGLEYGRFDITSNSIAIGFAQTKLLEKLGEEAIADLKKSISKKAYLPPEEFVKCVRYLISAEYLNGATIELDGGLNHL